MLKNSVFIPNYIEHVTAQIESPLNLGRTRLLLKSSVTQPQPQPQPQLSASVQPSECSRDVVVFTDHAEAVMAANV